MYKMEDPKKISHTRYVFDDVLIHIGEFGIYQFRLFLFLCIPSMLCAIHKLSWVFLGAYAEHRCLLPWEQAHNASFFSVADNQALISGPLARCEFPPHINDSETCDEWVFDTTEYSSSAVFEFRLVCGWEWARGSVNTVLVVGGLIGAILFGNISDRLGRRPVFFAAIVLQACAGVLASVAPTFWSFVLARLALGMTTPGVYLTSCVLAMELVGRSKRQYATIVMQAFFSFGYLMTALMAFLVTDWRHLQLLLSVPGLFCLSYWWLISESPRWLMGQGRVAESSIVLKKAANFNNKLRQKDDVVQLETMLTCVSEGMKEDTDKKAGTSPSLFHLMRYYPNLRCRALIMLALWFVNGASYFGLSWNTGDLAGNDYVNFSMSGLVELPAHVIVLLVVNWKGRVPMQSGSLLVGAIALTLASLVPEDMTWLLTTLAMFGKMSVTASYGTGYILSGEIFPTCVRNAGMGVCSTMGALGAIAASFIVLLSSVWSRLPFLVISGLGFVGALLACILPETLNAELPDTLEDGENFKK